jgi:hypothetical protein
VPREIAVMRALDDYRWRFRLAELSVAVVTSAALAGIVLVAAWASGAPPAISRALTIVVFSVCAAVLGAGSWQRWTTARVAARIESCREDLDNLVVTAEEIARRDPSPWHPVLAAEVARAAVDRLATVSANVVQPLSTPLSLGFGTATALAILIVALPSARGPATRPLIGAEAATDPVILDAGDVRVVITPPDYARRETATLLNPPTIAVLDGSRIRLEVPPAVPATLVNLNGTTDRFTEEQGRRSLEFAAVESRPLLIRFEPATGASPDRLVHLRVQSDERPVVRIEQPAKDLIFPDSTGTVAVTITARDDVGLEALSLRYTKVSGSGETFTFQEGEWPVRIERPAAGDWTAHAEFSLATLNLEDGDTLVYRAAARDGKPGADPALSDSFLIEVGRLAGVASTGFALPEERDRQAISQQMLIIKTEKLHADRAALSQEAFVEQARLLAIEQRMVKAEFEFMTGGVVEDEVEEAAHSHELAEGRFENTGQVELITAIREMSRAEARLNSADTAEALVNERAALRALQRAFDRRRYLLRTLPERARIDLSRRLSGELATARSSTQAVDAKSLNPFLERAREVVRDLDAATAPINAAALASRILALDPQSEELQKAALNIAAARDGPAVTTAIREAQHLIARTMQQHLATASPTVIHRDPFAGRLVQELAPGRTPR